MRKQSVYRKLIQFFFNSSSSNKSNLIRHLVLAFFEYHLVPPLRLSLSFSASSTSSIKIFWPFKYIILNISFWRNNLWTLWTIQIGAAQKKWLLTHPLHYVALNKETSKCFPGPQPNLWMQGWILTCAPNCHELISQLLHRRHFL